MNQTSCNLKGEQKVFWLHLGKASSCCRSHSEPLPSDMSTLLQHWKQEHGQLEQGIPIPGCSVCWKDQAQGRTSYRQQNSHKSKNTIQLWINNTCNQMCSYCSPKFSSTWQQSIQEHGPFQNVSSTSKNNHALLTENIDQTQWIENIREYLQSQPPNSIVLTLLGGEPLMQVRSLQKLLDLASPSISQLQIVTNLNPPTNKFLIWLLDNIPSNKFRFEISIDATPEYNHVPRAGFDADQFKINLQLLQDRGIEFSMSSVVSVLNVFDLPRFINWSKPYQVKFNTLDHPDCLNPIWLPKHILDQIKDQFEQEPPMIFQELYQENTQSLVDLKLFEQYNYLCQYFSRTNIDPKQINNDLFQQYWTWLFKRQK